MGQPRALKQTSYKRSGKGLSLARGGSSRSAVIATSLPRSAAWPVEGESVAQYAASFPWRPLLLRLWHGANPPGWRGGAARICIRVSADDTWLGVWAPCYRAGYPSAAAQGPTQLMVILEIWFKFMKFGSAIFHDPVMHPPLVPPRLGCMDDFNLSHLGVAKPSRCFFGSGGLRRWLSFNMPLSLGSFGSFIHVYPKLDAGVSRCFSFLGGFCRLCKTFWGASIGKFCTWNPLMTSIFEEPNGPKWGLFQSKQGSLVFQVDVHSSASC